MHDSQECMRCYLPCPTHTCDVDLVVEGLDQIGRLLTRHRVHDEQRVRRLDGTLDVLQLLHHVPVNLQGRGEGED